MGPKQKTHSQSRTFKPVRTEEDSSGSTCRRCGWKKSAGKGALAMAVCVCTAVGGKHLQERGMQMIPFQPVGGLLSLGAGKVLDRVSGRAGTYANKHIKRAVEKAEHRHEHDHYLRNEARRK